MTPLTPEEARAQLATAETLATTSRTAARIGAVTTAGVGLLVGGALALSGLFARTNTAALLIGMGLYTVALIALMVWHSRRVRVADRGWNRRHFSSFVLTMVLYAMGTVWGVSSSPSWAVFGPYCVLVALPMILAAGRTARR